MNTDLNFPRRLLAGLTALALLLMLALPSGQKGRRPRSCRSPSTVWKTFLQLGHRLPSRLLERGPYGGPEHRPGLTGVDFAGIPTFSGTFDGNGHTISGLSLVDDGSVDGLLPLHPGRRRGDMI